MTDFINDLVTTILGAPPLLVYAVVALVVLAETAALVGFVFPGETIAVVGGVTATLGHTNLFLMTLVVCLAAIIGDAIGYRVGQTVGRRVLRRPFFARREAQIGKAQQVLRDRGGFAVFIARWTAFLRTAMPAMAGTSRMPFRTFLLWDALGGISWGVVSVLAGYAAGRSYQGISTWLGTGSAVLLAIVVLAGITFWWARRHHAQSLEADAATEPATDPASQPPPT